MGCKHPNTGASVAQGEKVCIDGVLWECTGVGWKNTGAACEETGAGGAAKPAVTDDRAR